MAALLLQENDGKLYPVDYTSKKLNLTEARHPIIEKECLAVVWGVKKFKLYLTGRRFTLQTDDKPLRHLKDTAYQKDRVFRWAIAVQEYSFRVEDIPVKETWELISSVAQVILVNVEMFSCNLDISWNVICI